jgi:Domain of unknown function (DUF4190)
MKTNSTCAKAECPKEFPDNLNFCQICGARLTEVVAEDPFKTVVASSSLKNDNEIFNISESTSKPEIEPIDAMKTMMVSNIVTPELIVSEVMPEPIVAEIAIEPPFFNEPEIQLTDFDKFSKPASQSSELDATLISSEIPNFDGTFTGMPLPSDSPYRSPTDEPISSPFAQPLSNPFDSPLPYESPTFKEPELVVPSNSPLGSPFSNPSVPYGQQNQMEQAWTPPPAPDANWGNQGVGQNTPFQTPPISSGQNQTLAIVSLVLGILSICCYIGWATGPAALITGWLHRKKVKENPAEFTGDGLALAGMITGGIFTGIWLLLIIVYVVIFGLAAATGSFR